MAYLLVRHTVADYARWKPIFDEDGARRKAGGCKGGTLLRNADKPNELVILFEWDSKENAQKFAHTDELRQAMERAGVLGMPDIYFLDKIEDLTR